MTCNRVAIIDSGVGALTIYQALLRLNCNCQYYIVSDSKHYPYGTKTIDFIAQRIEQLVAETLKQYRTDCIIIACNTATTSTISQLRQQFDCRFVGVVPAVKPAAKVTKSGQIAVLCTETTANSNYLKQLITTYGGRAQYHIIATTELTDTIEQSMLSGEQLNNQIIDAVCDQIQQIANCDTVVLGCTHYAIAKPSLQQRLPQIKHWIDSSSAIAKQLQNLLQPKPSSATMQHYFTETGQKYHSIHFQKQLKTMNLQYSQCTI